MSAKAQIISSTPPSELLFAGTGAIPFSKNEYEQMPRFRTRDPNFVVPSFFKIPHLPTPGNQGSLNTCVGWVVSEAKAIQDANGVPSTSTTLAAHYNPMYSYLISTGADTAQCKGGITVASALRGMLLHGALPFSDWELDDDAIQKCQKLPDTAVSQASNYPISDWDRASQTQGFTDDDLDDFRYLIAHNTPIIILIQMTSSFNSVGTAHTLSIAGTAVKKNGAAVYHTVLVVGYDKSSETFLIENSWGTSWGNGGFLDLTVAVMKEIGLESYVLANL